MGRLLKGLLVALGLVVIGVSAVSLLAWDRWWITVISYPWEQITLASILVLVLTIFVLKWQRTAVKVWVALLTAAVIYQVQVLVPFTVAYPKAVPTVAPASSTFQLLESNVKMANRQAARYLDLVEQVNPDVVQVIELNDW